MAMIHENALKRAEDEVSRRASLMEDASMRQRYHFMPQSGWMNDPNGLIYFRGKYHLFYQFNPYDAFWGSMHWGHAVSTDLLTWEHLPVALAPSEAYDCCERGGCFSGSAIECDGKLCLLYTGASNYGGRSSQAQCLAVSEDGLRFKKHENNPIITPLDGYDPANFRDPKVWKNGDEFYLICAAKKKANAQVLLYRSDNLTDWEYVNILYESEGNLGCMWECPDIFPLEDKYVLTFSPMCLNKSTSMYMVGDLDYATGKFHPLTCGEIDFGFDFYAAQSFLDNKGSRIIIAWANAWDWMPWFKDWGPTYKEHWCGMFTLPREVKLNKDNTLRFVPIEELQQLRLDEEKHEDILIKVDSPFDIKAGDGVSLEILIKIDLLKTTAHSFELLLRCNDSLKTTISFDLKKSEMTVDRNLSDNWSRGVTCSIIDLKNKSEFQVHVFSDQSSIEVFTDDYRTAHSCNIFANNSQDKNYLLSRGGDLFVEKIIAWGIRQCIV